MKHLNLKLPSGKRSGYSLVELIFALALFSLILMLSVKPFSSASFQREAMDAAFMNQLKAAILQQRILAARDHSPGYQIILDGQGKAIFRNQGRSYLTLDDPVYRVYRNIGERVEIQTKIDFRNTLDGKNGFTLHIYRKDRLMGKLIVRAITSTIREEYDDSD